LGDCNFLRQLFFLIFLKTFATAEKPCMVFSTLLNPYDFNNFLPKPGICQTDKQKTTVEVNWKELSTDLNYYPDCEGNTRNSLHDPHSCF
jgi:hypothetical protein